MKQQTQKYKTPFADLLPPLTTEERAALKADIAKRGQLDPIYVDEENNVLDGHNRLELVSDPWVETLSGLSENEKRAFVLSRNFKRRNLSPTQKDAIRKAMKKVAKALRETDKKQWTQARLAVEFGVTRQCVAKWLDRHSATGSKTPKPDARVKLTKEGKAQAVERVANGETQTQVAADLGVDQKTISRAVTAEKKKAAENAEKEQRLETAKERVGNDDLGIVEGDFREVAKTIPDGSVDLIFTDPPYDRETLPLYGELAEVASRVLCEGGSLICYLGQYQISEVIGHISPHLRLWWTLAVRHGGKSARMTEYGVVVKWKPLLWFVKGTRGDKHTFVDDLVESSQEKNTHEWQQSIVEARYYIEKLCPKGNLVFDPFCGGGTTAIAARQTDRRCLTCDVDGNAVILARKRLKDELSERAG